MKTYDVLIIGAGAGGLFAASRFINSNLKVAIIEKGNRLENRVCPIGKKVDKCIQCNSCSIMSGAGGAGAFSDGKYCITNDFGGDFYSYVGKEKSIELMKYVDDINVLMAKKQGLELSDIFPSADSNLKREALKHDLHILDANIRHLGTDNNYKILQELVNSIADKVDIHYNEEVVQIEKPSYAVDNNIFVVTTNKETYNARYVIVAAGRSGSSWVNTICKQFNIEQQNTKVDIGIRFECLAETWELITNQVYESKILYRSPKTGCTCRTFCMNPHGEVVTENTNGILTVNGHSYEDKSKHTNNTNFALLVTHNFTEPFKDSNRYGEYVASLVNMLANGVMVQRFGDLLDNRRTNEERLLKSFVRPTLNATPGNLGLCMPKQTLDTIIEMIFALDKLVPGTANYDSLLYGLEVKFYNSIVKVNNHLESEIKNLFFIGDCSGTTHSLAQASAEGIYVADYISGVKS